MSQSILERLTFDQLFQLSDPKRILRAQTVKGPPMEIERAQDSLYYLFNFKSSPSTTGLRHKGYIKFFKPKYGAGKRPLESLECLVDCTCFGPDTPVLMSDGTYKPISRITDGDYVYTHTGKIRRVLGNVARKPKPDEKVFRVKMTGFPTPLIVTENHPFYALRGRDVCGCGCGKSLEISPSREKYGTAHPSMLVERRFLKGHGISQRTPNDRIELVQAALTAGDAQLDICRKYQVSKGTVYNIASGNLKPKAKQKQESRSLFSWVKPKDFRKREWILSPWLEEGCGGSLNPFTARFLGYYAAEGSIPKRDDVRLTFHLSEENTLVADIIGIIQSRDLEGTLFRVPQQRLGQGDPWHIYRMDGGHLKRPQQCLRLTCHVNPEFKEFIVEHIGCGSSKKRLSAWFMSLDNETLKEFVTGLFLGDGHFRKNGTFRWSSVSNTLVWNVSTILRRLKIDHVITPVGGGNLAIDVTRGNSARAIHALLKPYLREEAAVRECLSVDDGDFYFPEGSLKVVREKEEIDYDGEVWDLCVEEDHSFIAAGVAVANCPDYRFRWSWVNKQRGSSIVGPNSLNQAINRAPRKTNPKSNPGLCIAKGEIVATKRGLLPIEQVRAGDSAWTLQGWKPITAAAKTGEKSVVEINTRSGKKLALTADHRVLAFHEKHGLRWIAARDLSTDDRLCETLPEGSCLDKLPEIKVEGFTSWNSRIVYDEQTIPLNSVLAELTGYMVAEGSQTLFAGQLDAITSDFSKKWKSVFGKQSVTQRVGGCYIGNHGTRILSTTGFKFGSYNKVVPQWIMASGRTEIIAFLRGCYAGDGNFRGHHSTYATVSEVLARQIHLLLGCVGIQANLDMYLSGVNSSKTWVLRTSSAEETQKLFNLLQPIRGYSSIPKDGGKSALSNYIVENPAKMVSAVIARHVQPDDQDSVVPLAQAIKSVPGCERTSSDSVSRSLSKRGKLKKQRFRKGGKAHNVVRLADLYDELRAHAARQITRRLNLPKSASPWKTHRLALHAGISKLKYTFPAAFNELHPIIREDVRFDQVVSIKPAGISEVYDLTVPEVEHFTANGFVVHNCKHILATREYIYGMLSTFPPGIPDTAEKLDKLTRYAQKRWVDMPGLMAQAREREKKIAQAKAARKAGLPVPGTTPPPAAEPTVQTAVPPEPVLKKPGPPEDQLPVPLPEPQPVTPDEEELLKRVAVPPNQRKIGFPPNMGKPTQKKPGIKSKRKKPKTESVVSSNGQPLTENMNNLDEARGLIEQMVDDEEKALVPADDSLEVGGAEPGDSAIGADTEGAAALDLLREIRDLLGQLTDELAPADTGADEEELEPESEEEPDELEPEVEPEDEYGEIPEGPGEEEFEEAE